MVTQNMDTTLDLILRKPCCDLFSAMFAKCCTTPDMYANAITKGTSQDRFKTPEWVSEWLRFYNPIKKCFPYKNPKRTTR